MVMSVGELFTATLIFVEVTATLNASFPSTKSSSVMKMVTISGSVASTPNVTCVLTDV